MKRFSLYLLFALVMLSQFVNAASGATSFTTVPFSENELKANIRLMLAKHTPYAESQYKTAGYFGNGQSVEHGARTNADYAFVYAFIYKKAQDQTLPNGNTFANIKSKALAALRYSLKTHQTGTVNCTDGKKWGLVWESSMWSTSVAFAAWLLWDDLTLTDKENVKKLIIAEANFKLQTPIPTAITQDTKAEENGWDTNILAFAAAMYPDEVNASAWDYRCKQYAMNTYSVDSDKYDYRVVDGKYVRDWHIGPNLFNDYALENHNFFHTSYLNIPIQEMSESLLAYKAVQNQSNPRFKIPQALKHNVPQVWNSMLKEFILPEGILSMPNGNDWSMYIYDELSTFSALACVYRDPDALMLESMVLQFAKHRQTTTSDGSFLLNPDVGERRMGVTARRLVFAHLYHEYFSTADMQATAWADFSAKHESTKYLPYNRIIRSNNAHRYVTFSWFQSSDGTSYKSYMGMVSPNNINTSNIVFPFKAGNTGNFTGYVDVNGKARNATLMTDRYLMYPKSFTTTGKLSVNDGAITQYSSFYATPGNAVIYMDEQYGNVAGTITKNGGLMLGITTDVLTSDSRKLYSQSGMMQSNGATLSTLTGNWVNIDNSLGMITESNNGSIAFGQRELKTSVNISKLYGAYSENAKTFAAGEKIVSRTGTVYANIDASTTQKLAAKAKYPQVAAGWKAAVAEDPDGRRYMLLSNFTSNSATNLTLSYSEGAPVFERVTQIRDTTGNVVFNFMSNVAVPNVLNVFVKTNNHEIKAVQGNQPNEVYLLNEKDSVANLSVTFAGKPAVEIQVNANQCLMVKDSAGVINQIKADFPANYRNISRGKHIIADSQLSEHFPFATIDEDDSTYYESMLLPEKLKPQNLTLRLWGSHAVNQLIIHSFIHRGPKDIEILYSKDGYNFISAGVFALQNTDEKQIIPFNIAEASYLRIKINSSYGDKSVVVNGLTFMGSPL